ncbi:MAG: ACP S-malonyltransferase [Rhodospirillaceae bacterium]|jgi:[acyl-carrier-protein] S-malonyltransferase|nr:ACP S-malonyltransferase [Rhodospirillaceae bacterium]
MTRAFVYPGQGSQAVGMGQELASAFAVAKQLFEEVDEALGQPLTKLMFEGPEEELTLTANAQPALMAVSLAIMRILESEGGLAIGDTAKFVAGHSLGEYSALTAAKAFGVTEAARILKIRGTAMQEAVPVGEGTMAALMGVEMDVAEEIAAEAAQGEICTAANDNASGQIVLSGATAAIERALEIATDKGAKRSILLPVSAPFHCAMMAPAADVMADELAAFLIDEPIIPVVANVTADAQSAPDEIRRLLVEQVTARVRWRESVLFMKENGVDTLVEIGTGKVLTGLTRRIDRDLNGVSIQTPEDIEEFLKTL